MPAPFVMAGRPILVSNATNANISGPTNLLGILVASSTAGTVALYDDPATGTTIQVVNTMTLSVGWLFVPIKFLKGINFVGGGTFTGTLIVAD